MFVLETRKTWRTAAGVPWWQRGLLLVAFLLLLATSLVVMTVLFLWILFVTLFYSVASAFSRFLPASWRRAANQQPVTAPVEGVECPWCNARIETEPVDENMQQGRCSGCGRELVRQFQSTPVGVYWSPWQALEGAGGAGRRLVL